MYKMVSVTDCRIMVENNTLYNDLKKIIQQLKQDKEDELELVPLKDSVVDFPPNNPCEIPSKSFQTLGSIFDL